MKKNVTISVVLFFVSCFVFSLNAQVSDSNLSKKFSTLFNNSSSYQNYKMVNTSDALDFQIYLQNYIQREQSNQLAIKNKLIENEKELLVFDSDFKLKERIKHDGSGIYYYFFDQGKFFINKDLRKFNLEASVEDTVFFQGVEY